MGGSPFEAPDTQGFVTGLFLDPNGAKHQVGARGRVLNSPHVRPRACFAASLLTALGCNRWLFNSSTLLLQPRAPARPQGDSGQQLRTLLHRSDWVRSALAGNLK